MDKEYKYKPGDFGDIKEMVRRANENSKLPWEKGVNDAESKASNDLPSVETTSSNKKPTGSTKKTNSKRSSKNATTNATATESKKTKKPAKKQASEGNKPKVKDKVPPSNSSADSDKACKTPSPTIVNLDALWNAAKASKTKKLKEEDQTQVWLDSKLLRQIELLNVKCGKPAPTKHVVNAILQMFLDGHRKELQKLK